MSAGTDRETGGDTKFEAYRASRYADFAREKLAAKEPSLERAHATIAVLAKYVVECAALAGRLGQVEAALRTNERKARGLFIDYGDALPDAVKFFLDDLSATSDDLARAALREGRDTRQEERERELAVPCQEPERSALVDGEGVCGG